MEKTEAQNTEDAQAEFSARLQEMLEPLPPEKKRLVLQGVILFGNALFELADLSSVGPFGREQFVNAARQMAADTFSKNAAVGERAEVVATMEAADEGRRRSFEYAAAMSQAFDQALSDEQQKLYDLVMGVATTV